MAIVRAVIALTLLVSVLGAACQPTGRAFQTTLQTQDVSALPVTLTDETAMVTGIDPGVADPADGNGPALRSTATEPNELVLSWLGGACDRDATVWFGVQDGGRLILSLATNGGSGVDCPAAGVPRAIRITTSSPITVDSITVSGG